jgi:FKBP-type peptidyl-prolyl cis-trans isomerase FklB
MKKIIFSFVLSLFAVAMVTAQSKTSKTTVKTTVKTASVPALKTLEDSASYAIGLSVVNFYKTQGFTKISSSIVARAIMDAQTGKKQPMDDASANQVIMNCLNKQSTLKSKPTIDAGEAFLAKNKNKPGVMTTASGLQYEIITKGQGRVPTTADTVVCNYRGSFLDGKVFDESYSRGTPIEFPVTGVIRGWTEILQLMPEGSKYKVYVPYTLGYGASDYGPIPGGSMLTFEIELIKVK